VRLLKVALDKAREFAREAPNGVVRDAAGWTALGEQVLQESKVTGEAAGAQLTAERRKAVVDAFAQQYQKRFQPAPPTTVHGVGQLHRELQALSLPAKDRPKLALVLAVVGGECLARAHGAGWHLTDAPLPGKGPAADESPFVHPVNPFLPAAADG